MPFIEDDKALIKWMKGRLHTLLKKVKETKALTELRITF